MESATSNVNATTEVQETEIEILEAQVRSEHEMYLRALADFDNYRRRSERDIAGAIERGKRSLVFSFLEVVDSFERALQQAANAPSALVQGLEAVHRKTLGLLEAEGITPYTSLGETFNPALHEAVASVVSTQHDPGTVVEELQRGYRAAGVVLRPAQVRVSQ